MKRIYGWIAATWVVTAFYACQKDDAYPGTGPVPYQNAEQVIVAVDSLYRLGAPTFYGESRSSEGPAAAAGGYLAGFFENRSTRSSTLYEHLSGLTFTADNVTGYLNHLWNQSYAAIRIANELIERVVGTPDLSAEEQSQRVAEARFFRAYNYFHLAKTFGGVPLVRDYRNSADSIFRASPAAVYELIVSDLRLAVSYLEEAPSDATRIGRTAAQTLLADVYLTLSGYPLQQDQYAQAAEMARQVIRSGRHALLPNGATAELSAYNALMSSETNTECIYRYPSSGASLAALCLPDESSEWGVVKRTTRNVYQPAESFLALYDQARDLRMQERQYFHSFLKYERSGRTVIQTYAPLPYGWFDESALLGTGTPRGGTILYRYAEVLLIAAEAIAATEGVTPEAVDYLAQVRTRAFPDADAAEITQGLSALSTEAFIEEVWAERLREFALEMKAWGDIQRTRKYPERIQAADSTTKIAFRDVVGATNPSGRVFKEEHLLLPVPRR